MYVFNCFICDECQTVEEEISKCPNCNSEQIIVLPKTEESEDGMYDRF